MRINRLKNYFFILSILFNVFTAKSYADLYQIYRNDIFTPNNTSVANCYIWSEELPDAVIYQNDADFSTIYPNAQLLSSTSRQYSCHGYAWHMYEYFISDKVNIPIDETPTYWNDGSYVKVESFANDGTTEVSIQNAIVLYTSDAGIYGTQYHSGVTGSDPNMIISKWGEYGPLMKHELRYCPYDGNTYVPPMIALLYDVYIRAAQITNFNKETIPENATKFYKIVPEEDIELTVEFNNPTEGINNKINKVELYYKADDDPDENKILISTLNSAGDGLPFVFKWNTNDMPGISLGNKYEFITTIYYQNDENTIGDDRIHIEFVPRKIQIVRETTEEFLVYDFENAFNLYLSGQFYHEEELSNNAFTIPAYNDVELYDVDWCEEYGSNEGVYAGVYPSSLLITDYSYLWNSDTWPGSKKHEYSKTIDYSEIFSSSVKPDHPHHPEKESTGKTWFFDFDGDNRLQLRPGLYRFLGNVYQKSTYPQTLVKMADTDTLTIFIPSWKMKTEPDLRYGKDRAHFRKGNDIEICIWRPVNGLKANNTQVNLYSDNKAQLLSSETVSYADSLGVTTMVIFPSTNLDHGFYTIEAKEIDYTTGREVIYQNEIQVCPLYVRWENGGLWPSDWPGTNDLYWRLSQFANTDPLIKSYAMKNNYDYDTDLYPLMNTQLSSPSVTLTKPYDAFMQIYIGLWRLNNIFKELLAEYTVSISVDNKASWTKLKTATVAEWATYPWPTTLDRWCFASTQTAIEYTNQPIYIKLSGIDTKGIPRDTIFTEGVMYDEIMIAYTKADLLETPENLTAQFYEASKYSALQLTWDQSPDYQTGRFYRLYRDGIVIADQLATLSFLDYGTVADKMYNYIVTLVDPSKYLDDPAYESPKAGNSIDVFTGYIPPPGNLVISQGVGVEYNNVTLNWQVPLEVPENLTGYNVYRNNEFINKTSALNYTDYFLKDGVYSYKITALYSNPYKESVPCEEVVITISSNFFLPVLAYFENEGVIPADWQQYSTADLDWIYIDQHPAGLTFPYETGYFAYFGSEQATAANTEEEKVYGSLKSPVYNFSNYAEVTLSYDYLFKSYRDNSVEFNVFIKDVDTNDSLLISGHTALDMLQWEGVPWVILPARYLNCNSRLIFEAALNKSATDGTVIGSVSLDFIELHGNFGLAPPQNIQITNNQGFINLRWDPFPEATAYHIYRSEYPDKNFIKIYTVIKRDPLTQEIITSYTDIRRRVGTGVTIVTPAVDTIRKPYYYKIATEINVKFDGSENTRTQQSQEGVK